MGGSYKDKKTMDNLNSGNDLAQKLPPQLQQALKRKSSRDPNSRFPCKLHMLLTYLETDPKLEEEIGLSWISDTEFKMNKKNVSQVMGIKLNTMNVNLRDLQFEQLTHDKGGWTQWRREGFTRTSAPNETHDRPIQPQLLPQATLVPQPYMVNRDKCDDLIIEKVTPNDVIMFRQIVNKTWQYLTNDAMEYDHDEFITKAAEYFKQQEQPISNAIEVLKAIIAPGSDRKIKKTDLFKFLAMFGPKETAMIKIESLLNCSNNQNFWLTFDNSPSIGSFSDLVPNCLILKFRNNSIHKFWNNPLQPTRNPDSYIDNNYIVGDGEYIYSCWKNALQQLENSGYFIE